jgi:hypothetical protein
MGSFVNMHPEPGYFNKNPSFTYKRAWVVSQIIAKVGIFVNIFWTWTFLKNP